MREELERVMQLDLHPLRNELEKLEFSFTEECIPGGAFLFRDGKYLCCNADETKKAMESENCRIVSHWMVDDYIKYHFLIDMDADTCIRQYGHTLGKQTWVATLQARILEFTDGVIVLNDGTNYPWETAYVDFPVLFKPTKEQLDKVEAWLDKRLYEKTYKINISLGEVLKEYDLEDGQTTVDDIMKDIQRLYNERERKD